MNYRPGAKGKPAKITISPAAAAKSSRIANTSSTGGSSNTIKINRSYGSNKITVSGRLPPTGATGSA